MSIKWWGNKNKSPESQDLSQVIRVIGDRASGKTTYMAALARWPNADPATSAVRQVQAIHDNGEKLIDKAKNLLEQGESLEPTPLNAKPEEVKDYSLQIVLQEKYGTNRAKIKQDSAINLIINCKDYAGEFFSDLVYQPASTLLQDYMADCVGANGFMLLLDGMAFRQDEKYFGGIDKFLVELDRAEIGTKFRRVAIAVTKCEQSELWVNRHKPDLIVEARFPKTLQRLREWEQLGAGSIDCFTTSAFGMVGNHYRKPNMECLARDREGIKASVIKYPRQWKPFGLVAPIYWLCTGKRHPQLDNE